MLGHEGVVTAVVGGGRLLAERQILVPWGDRAPEERVRSAARPWPGSLPELAPATVFREPHPVSVLTEAGEPVDVDERGMLTGAPHAFSATARPGDLHRGRGVGRALARRRALVGCRGQPPRAPDAARRRRPATPGS